MGKAQVHRVAPLPLGLVGPAVVGDVELQAVVGFAGAVLAHALVHEGGDVLDAQVLPGGVGQRGLAPGDGQPRIGLQAILGHQAVGRVHLQLQKLPPLVLFDAVAHVAPLGGHAAHVVLIGVEAAGALAGHLYRQELAGLEGGEEARLGPRGDHRHFPGIRQGGEVHQLHGPVVVHAKTDVQPALAEFNDHGTFTSLALMMWFYSRLAFASRSLRSASTSSAVLTRWRTAPR